MPSGGSKDLDAFVALRLPMELREALERDAKRYNRGLSDYIRCVLCAFTGVDVKGDELRKELRKRVRR